MTRSVSASRSTALRSPGFGETSVCRQIVKNAISGNFRSDCDVQLPDDAGNPCFGGAFLVDDAGKAVLV
jgi:hypothetical protein